MSKALDRSTVTELVLKRDFVSFIPRYCTNVLIVVIINRISLYK